MSFWKRSDVHLPEVEKSEKLCRDRDGLLLKFPAIMKEWNSLNQPVQEAAKKWSVIILTQDPEKIIEVKQALQRAIWARDGVKHDFQRKVDELNSQIEALNAAAINEKHQEWRESLSQLRDKKAIEKVTTRETVAAGRMVVYKSNFRLIDATKGKILESISALREMRHSPLSTVHEFIKRTEEEFSGIDFTVLKEEDEVTEREFEQLCSRPETAVYTTARLVPGPQPGQTRIEKNYDLPVREYK